MSEIKIKPESEAVAEINRRMEKWMEEQYASFWRDGEVVKTPKNLQIFLATKEQLEDILLGRKKTTNIPEDAWLYDIRGWERTDVLDSYAFWMVHPSFPEYRSGTCAPAYPMLFE